MTSTTFPHNPAALDTWSVAELVAWFMAATETLLLCDDGHEMTVERAGQCDHEDEDEDEDGEICYGRGTCCCRRCDP